MARTTFIDLGTKSNIAVWYGNGDICLGLHKAFRQCIGGYEKQGNGKYIAFVELRGNASARDYAPHIYFKNEDGEYQIFTTQEEAARAVVFTYAAGEALAALADLCREALIEATVAEVELIEIEDGAVLCEGTRCGHVTPHEGGYVAFVGMYYAKNDNGEYTIYTTAREAARAVVDFYAAGRLVSAVREELWRVAMEMDKEAIEKAAREAERLELEAEAERQRIEAEAEEAEERAEQERRQWAHLEWWRLAALGGWWSIETQNGNYLVFAPEEGTLLCEFSDGTHMRVFKGRAMYVAPDGELLREIYPEEVGSEVADFALAQWDNPNPQSYAGTVWRQHFVASGRDYQHFDLAEEMARRVDFTELQTPEQVWAYLEITEREEPDPDALKIEFVWSAGYRECKNWFSVTKETENGDIEISYHRRTGERITIIDCK